MGEAAVAVARLCDYVGAGTVEFLLNDRDEFYFLEMNTRLQVEHPVTEMVTGQDLVAWQLQVAAGQDLPLRQEQIVIQGHAIEARLYAEDPYRDYLPQTGTIHLWQTETLPGVRIDSVVQSGTTISAFYDPMLAKVMAHGSDRTTALRKLQRALDHCVLLGPSTNRGFLRQLITHPVFQAGASTTAFIPEHQSDWHPVSIEQTHNAAIIAAALIHTSNAHAALPGQSRIQLASHDARFTCTVQGRQQLTVSAGDKALNLSLELAGWRAQIQMHEPDQPSIKRTIHYYIHEESVYLDDGIHAFCFTDITHRAESSAGATGSGRLLSPMAGCLLALNVEAGDPVTAGDVVAIVEAMKMEHRIKADRTGVVQKIDAQQGQQLKARQQIMQIGDTTQ
jgi:geranyl-CoA carboxylase alpha subunit